MWAVLQFSFWSGGRIAPPLPWGLSDNGLVSAVCLFTVGIPLIDRNRPMQNKYIGKRGAVRVYLLTC